MDIYIQMMQMIHPLPTHRHEHQYSRAVSDDLRVLQGLVAVSRSEMCLGARTFIQYNIKHL